MAIIQQANFGDILIGGATVVLIKYRDGGFAVGRYLPPGIDIAPSLYRGNSGTEAEARELFAQCCAYVEKLGYAPRK
jgi:hypothetical protein